MIDRLGTFVVMKRRLILAVALVLTVVCGVLFFFVPINSDMTKYLADSSSMKQGIDIMAEEFPETAAESTIRVMFEGLSDDQIDDVFARIDQIPYVSDIAYEKDDPAYNKDGRILLVLTVPYEYKTAEELSVEAALDEGIGDYDYVWHNDDTSPPGLALKVIIVAVLLILLVLFVMCPSWLEPILFLVAIGIAVIINLGTNIVMGSVSDTTFQIGAILQLALSMDYSVILMSRYRQEKAAEPDPERAMMKAFGGAFSSVAASSLTTVVGLLMLCFMSYKIGVDLGVSLAKGVFISMVSVLTLLPGLIVMCERGIERTVKPALHVGMDWAARYSYRVRVPVTCLLAAMFVLFYILQARTGIAFSLDSNDEVAAYFPADNTIVMVYENADEEAVPGLAEVLEADERVKSVTGYSTILGKPMTAGQLYRQIESMSDGVSLSPQIITMLFYGYYTGTETGSMPAGEFLSFLVDALENDPLFSANVDEEMLGNIGQLEKFADAELLTTPMTAAELADFLGMEEDDVLRLMVPYFSTHGNAKTATMTLPTFVRFVLYEVAADPDYGSMFDAGTLSQLRRLETFTDAGAMTSPRSYGSAASLLGIDSTMMKLVYAAIYAEDPSYDPGTVTLGQLAGFIQNDLLSTGMLSQFMDDDQVAMVQALASAAAASSRSSGSSSSSAAPDISADDVADIISDLIGQDVSADDLPTESEISSYVEQGTAWISDNLSEEDRSRIEEAVSGTGSVNADTAFTAADLEEVLGLDASTARLIVTMAAADAQAGGWALPMRQVVDYLAENDTFASAMDSSQRAQLSMLDTIINDSIDGVRYNPGMLASLLGMGRTQAKQLFLLYTLMHGDTSSWMVTPQEFVDFLDDEVLANPDYAELMDEDQAGMLAGLRALIDAVVDGEPRTSSEMAGLLSAFGEDFDDGMVDVLYLYKESQDKADPTQKMTLEELFTYLVDSVAENPKFSALLDEDARQALVDGRAELMAGKAQLVTGKYSRLIVVSSYPDESDETMAFIEGIEVYADAHFAGEYHLVGSSVMVHEMKQTFGREFLFITLMTALAIFLIVAFTFRGVVMPLVLVALVQTGVIITMVIIGAISGGMYYIALLIVECILMGSTIDYGILFTSTYREARASGDILTALKAAYRNSIHTILTSGLILVPVVGFLQVMFEEPAIKSIIQALAIGAFCVIVMILFILPGVLACLDRFVVKKEKAKRKADAAPALDSARQIDAREATVDALKDRLVAIAVAAALPKAET